VNPVDCEFLGPLECQDFSGPDFQCAVRTGYRLDSAASCSFETMTDLCIAVRPTSAPCDPTASCPVVGPATVWAGLSDYEPTVVIQDGCEAYPAFDPCIESSPDARCACACAAELGA
jgi:hypothetical protein